MILELTSLRTCVSNNGMPVVISFWTTLMFYLMAIRFHVSTINNIKMLLTSLKKIIMQQKSCLNNQLSHQCSLLSFGEKQQSAIRIYSHDFLCSRQKIQIIDKQLPHFTVQMSQYSLCPYCPYWQPVTGSMLQPVVLQVGGQQDWDVGRLSKLFMCSSR